MREPRRGWLVGFGVTAALLLMSSSAFACTIFKGQLTVQGNGNDPATGHKSSITVYGSGRGMSYCDGSVTSDLPADAGYTYVDSDFPPAASVDVWLSPNNGDPDCPRSGQLPDGVYNVNFANSVAWTNVEGSRIWVLDCMFHEGESLFSPGVKNVGELTVAEGSAQGQFNLGRELQPNGPGDESSLCIANQGGQAGFRFAGEYGQMAPVTVL